MKRYILTLTILIFVSQLLFAQKADKKYVDEKKLSSLLKDDGLERQIIVNPITETEINRKVDGDDQLIVFARNGKEVEKRMKEVKFAP